VIACGRSSTFNFRPEKAAELARSLLRQHAPPNWIKRRRPNTTEGKDTTIAARPRTLLPCLAATRKRCSPAWKTSKNGQRCREFRPRHQSRLQAIATRRRRSSDGAAGKLKGGDSGPVTGRRDRVVTGRPRAALVHGTPRYQGAPAAVKSPSMCPIAGSLMNNHGFSGRICE
jgi:hypothetical protein